MAYMFGGVGSGVMKVLSTATAGVINFQMANWSQGVSAQNAALAGVSASTAGNYQFLLTLRNYTYVYVFGERMGDVVVTGIAGLECANFVHGLTTAITYYTNYRIAATGTALALQFAGYVAVGFLVGGTFQYMNPESRLARFQFNFKTIPS